MNTNTCKYCGDRIPDNVDICSACVRLQDALMEVPDAAAMAIIKDMAAERPMPCNCPRVTTNGNGGMCGYFDINEGTCEYGRLL